MNWNEYCDQTSRLFSCFTITLICLLYFCFVFTMHHINHWFTCITCRKLISPAPVSCRNHCPYCFTSLHVDDQTPGDRQSSCHGLMLPDYYIYNHQSSDIHFICIQCWHSHTNKQNLDDDIAKLDYLIAYYRYYIATKTLPSI